MYKITKQQHGSITDTFTVMETISVPCHMSVFLTHTIHYYSVFFTFEFPFKAYNRCKAETNLTVYVRRLSM